MLVCLAFAVTATAKPRTKAQMTAAAQKILNEAGQSNRIPRTGAMKELQKTTTYTIFGYEGGGFAVISADDLVPEVLGFSDHKFSGEENPNFKWWLLAMDEVVKDAVKRNVPLKTTTPDPEKYPTQVGPLMTTFWDQLDPYNRLCPISNGGDRCYTGCVATAMAQVLNYHEIPVHGIGTRTIYYPQGNVNGTAVTADFENDYYDWNNMLDTYTAGNFTEEEANAVALLMRDCGVAANMQYGGHAEQGSGAYSTDAAAGLRTYFGIETAQCLDRNRYSESDWMNIVYSELSENGPLYYGGASWFSGGHAFVLHGYNAQGMVYVNWGWSGSDDGYYDIALLNPSGYSFSDGQDMIIGVKGEAKALYGDTITIEVPGTLPELLPENRIDSLGTLKVIGAINSTDLKHIRLFAGRDSKGEETAGHLATLDLSEATVVAGGEPYLTEGAANHTTADNDLPYKAFYGCKPLQSVKLPAGIKTYNDGVIGYCTRLKEVEFNPADDRQFFFDGTFVMNTEQTELIALMPSTTGEIEIPQTVTRVHDYALSGCARLSKLRIPATIEWIGTEAMRGCSMLTEIRAYAKEPPALGGPSVFEGVSKQVCKLYVRSDTKAKYQRAAQWKDFYGTGYDNIVEFGTTVKARNAIREYGEPNPSFGYQIKGDPVQGVPELSCEATETSPAGRYTITITRGTITEEAVEFTDGFLIVQKAPLTATVETAHRQVGQPNPTQYNFTYEGFKNGEDESVIITPPTVTTDADEASPAGQYVLTLSGGEAQNYEFSYVDGILIVEEVTDGIEGVTEDKGQRQRVHTITGVQVGQNVDINELPRGVYIINGKKLVVK